MSKSKTIMAALAVVIVAAGAACIYAWQPAIAPLQAPLRVGENQPLLAQGARLAEVGDCMYCHTAKGGKPFAGGLAIDTPFGAIYSTNITPDAATGIGAWPLDAFTRALRAGVSRDGHLLYPAFPYTHFTKMSDGDIAALYAYLMARVPVHAPAHPNALVFPLNFRPLMAGWNLLFLHRGALPAPGTPQSAEWTRGRYLVEGPAHCAACHTPMNLLGAEKSGQAFAGGQIDGWDAPALTALLRAPKPWTHEQLASYLSTGLASEHGAAAGPMLPVTRHLANVPEADVQAIATYIMSLQKADAAPKPPAAPAADPARVNSGAIVFAAACASCHGAAAPMGAIGGRPSLALSTALNSDSPRNAVKLILEGNPWNGSASAHYMPPFAATLSDGQIADVLAYARTNFAQRPAWPKLAGMVAALRKETQPQ